MVSGKSKDHVVINRCRGVPGRNIDIWVCFRGGFARNAFIDDAL
jgi:hypothetical protein